MTTSRKVRIIPKGGDFCVYSCFVARSLPCLHYHRRRSRDRALPNSQCSNRVLCSCGVQCYIGYISSIFKSNSNISGPRLTAMTLWHEFYQGATKRGRYSWETKKMHLHCFVLILCDIAKAVYMLLRLVPRPNHTLRFTSFASMIRSKFFLCSQEHRDKSRSHKTDIVTT